MIDVTNACRTLLVSLETLDWDDDLLALFGVPRELLPRIVRSAETVGEGELLGARPVRGIAGDQQAALYGQGCHAPARGRRRTAPAASCSCTPATMRARRRTGS